jgi:2-methylisocitrate lyase-like PEP mutase family enzyme
MHMHRTIGMSEAAGFEAIEIEDQLVPKRATTTSASST